MRHDVRVRLDLLDQPIRFQPLDDLLARVEAIDAVALPASRRDRQIIGDVRR